MNIRKIIPFVVGNTLSYDLYPSTDIAVLAGTAPSGTGARGYLSFGGQAVNNSTGRLYFGYSAQDDHNSTKNGQGMAMYSDDIWATHSSPVIVVANPGGGVNIQDIDIFVTSTGRTIFFYTKSPTGVGESIAYFKYTDNADLTGFSAEQRLTLLYSGAGDFIDSTGSCVEISGVIYKSCWGTDIAGATEIPIFKSMDNGVTWTLHSLVATSADNYDETCLARHPNGTVYAAIRDNSSQQLLIKYSTDNLATWSTVLNTGIGAKAKHGFVISPQGMFCIVTRNAPLDGRTVLIQSRDGITWSKQYIDGREGVYIYGTPVNHPSAGIVAMWCVEAANVPVAGSSGPSLIISKRIAQSQTSVSPPTVYDVDYQCLLDYAQANGETLPPDALKTKHNTFVSTLRTNSKLTMMDGYYVVKHNDATLTAFSKRNWRRAWITASTGGAPTYGVLGFDFDGVDDYFRLNMQLNLQSNFLQDSACFVIYTEDSTSGVCGGTGVGTFSTRTNALFLNPDFSGSAFALLNGDAPAGSVSNGGTTTGLWELNRSASTGFTVTRSGTSLGTIIKTSSVRAAADMYIGCERYASDNLQNFSARGFGLVGIGGSKASWNTEWATYIASL